MAANPKYGISKYGDRYSWTPLTHLELVEFLETKRSKTKLTKQELSLAANYSGKVYANLVIGSQRFSKKSFERIAKAAVDNFTSQLQIPMDQQPEKIEAPAKIEKPIYGVMSIQQMITEIKAAGYKVMRRTEGWEEI
jgi:hypothetical protein